MATTERYYQFDWHNMGEPLVPYLSIMFRGDSQEYDFPNVENTIYIENATFNVKDSSGYSTASITLADPNYFNLDAIFTKAMFYANSLSDMQTNWYCACRWGWYYYGENTGDRQNRRSSLHFYILKDLNYVIEETELVVTFNLLDIGASIMGSSENAPFNKKIGDLNISFNTNKNNPQISEDFNSSSMSAFHTFTTQSEMMAISNAEKNAAASVEEDEGKVIQEFTNRFVNKSYWEVIQQICSHAGIGFEIASEEPIDKDTKIDAITLNSNTVIKDAIEDLLNKMELKTYFTGNGSLTMRWSVLAGGWTKKDSIKQKIVFGYKQLMPVGDSAPEVLEQNLRLARVFVWKPGSLESVSRSECVIKNLSYTWSSKGYWNIGLPEIYGIAKLNEGGESGYYVFRTKQDWENRTDINGNKISHVPEIEKTTLAEASTKFDGLQVAFNFEPTTSTSIIESSGKSLILNMWNMLLREIIDIEIELFGDSWLDNTIFTADGDISDTKYHVNLYESYFVLNVYTPSSGDQTTLNKLLSGKYICTDGECSHTISAGEYSTRIKLIKAF